GLGHAAPQAGAASGHDDHLSFQSAVAQHALALFHVFRFSVTCSLWPRCGSAYSGALVLRAGASVLRSRVPCAGCTGAFGLSSGDALQEAAISSFTSLPWSAVKPLSRAWRSSTHALAVSPVSRAITPRLRYT